MNVRPGDRVTYRDGDSVGTVRRLTGDPHIGGGRHARIDWDNGASSVVRLDLLTVDIYSRPGYTGPMDTTSTVLQSVGTCSHCGQEETSSDDGGVTLYCHRCYRTTYPLPDYHTNADGTIPCCNCGKELAQTGSGVWIHCFGWIDCYGADHQEIACPLMPNDGEPDFYDERGWARS